MPRKWSEKHLWGFWIASCDNFPLYNYGLPLNHTHCYCFSDTSWYCRQVFSYFSCSNLTITKPTRGSLVFVLNNFLYSTLFYSRVRVQRSNSRILQGQQHLLLFASFWKTGPHVYWVVTSATSQARAAEKKLRVGFP